MTKLTITITKVGLERFTAAQLSADIDLAIASVGLTDTAFVVSPTLDKLPGEFRRIAAISGEQVGDNIVHMTMRDEAEVGYTARGFGLFLADGTLFGVYGQDDLLFEKSPRATFLAAIDVAFPTGDVRELTFGNTDFLNPPATTERKGVIRIATPVEVAEGTSTGTAVTPADLRQVLPIGMLMLWYGAQASIPAGWAICNGDEVDRSDGAGKIVTPDLRDRVAVGAGGIWTAGDRFGTIEKQTDFQGFHTHDVEFPGQTDIGRTGIDLTTTKKTETAGGGSDTTIKTVSLNDAGHTHTLTIKGATETAGTHAHVVDVTQPSLALFYIMKV